MAHLPEHPQKPVINRPKDSCHDKSYVFTVGLPVRRCVACFVRRRKARAMIKQ